jgi:hypothetical protein
MTHPFPIQPNDNRNPPKTTTEQDWLRLQNKPCNICGKAQCRPALHDTREIIEARLRA